MNEKVKNEIREILKKKVSSNTILFHGLEIVIMNCLENETNRKNIIVSKNIILEYKEQIGRTIYYKIIES